MTFSTSFVARFGDVDPAGIIYFARFLDFFHRALETYFDERLGLPYVDMVKRERVGVPVVRIEGDFKIPVAFGERFSVSVTPHALGRSSFTIAYTVHKPDREEPCARFRITHVTTNMETFRPVPIPPAIRAALEADLSSPT